MGIAGRIANQVRFIFDDAGRMVGYRNPVTDQDVEMLTPAQVAAVQASVLGGRLAAAPRAAYPQAPIGTFGDSIANITSYATQDLRQISGGACALTADRMAPHLHSASNGGLRLVFNGGVSGETTTQMLARDAAGSTATRKALTDAMTLGVRHLVFSAGINDLQHSALPASASAATIAATVATSVANLVALCQRAVAFGITPHIPALMGYRLETVSNGSLPTNNLAAVATTQAAVALWNAQAKAAIEGAGGALGYWYDTPAGVVDASGAWLPGMDQGDGLHPSENACRIVYAPIAQAIAALEGQGGSPVAAFPSGVNLFANADFSAATAGTATALNPYSSVGAGTITRSIVDWRGQRWQELIWTPTSLDGNGNAGLQIDLTVTTPAAGDVLGGEVSLYIDDGAGGPAPGLFQYAVRVRSGTNYSETPNSNPTIAPKVPRLAPIDGRFVGLPIVAPATPTPALISIVALVTQAGQPVRVRIARPRVVKLASAY